MRPSSHQPCPSPSQSYASTGQDHSPSRLSLNTSHGGLCAPVSQRSLRGAVLVCAPRLPRATPLEHSLETAIGACATQALLDGLVVVRKLLSRALQYQIPVQPQVILVRLRHCDGAIGGCQIGPQLFLFDVNRDRRPGEPPGVHAHRTPFSHGAPALTKSDAPCSAVTLTVIGSAEVIEAPPVLQDLHQLLRAAHSVRPRLARKQRRPGRHLYLTQSIGKSHGLFHRPPRHPSLHTCGPQNRSIY